MRVFEIETAMKKQHTRTVVLGTPGGVQQIKVPDS
jgi:hypothetical protein